MHPYSSIDTIAAWKKLRFILSVRSEQIVTTSCGSPSSRRWRVLYFAFCYHHHRIVPLARISLTLSCHFSLSFIASGKSSGLHPVSLHSCCMYVRAGRPAFARPYVGVHRSASLMSSSLFLQQCAACLVRRTWIVFVMEVGGRIVGSLWSVAARTCSILLATFLCNCRLAFSPAV